MELLQAVQTSIEIVQKLRRLNKAVSDAEVKMLLAELTSALADAKLEAGNLKLELAHLREESAGLRASLDKRAASEPDLHEGGYVFGEDGRHYCTACYDSRNRKVLLTEQPKDFQVFGKWRCPVCEQTFGPGRD